MPFPAPIFICLLSLKNELTPGESIQDQSCPMLTQFVLYLRTRILLNKLYNSIGLALVMPIPAIPQQLDYPSGY